MSRAQEIFDRINNEGMKAILGFIEDRKAEELFLDFKRASNDGKDKKFTEIDRKNLAKAISGFGNSEGGVIVWGIDCSRDQSGADVAKALIPIEDPEKFTSLLEGAISGCTIPPHSGVRNIFIKDSEDTGYVITLIPKSDATPHQSVVSKHYHIRAGSDFIPTPHDVLAGMFGRRPQPHVFHNFILATPSMRNEALEIGIGLMVHNEGPGIASDIFAICRNESLPGARCDLSMEIPDKTNWTGNYGFNRQLSLIGIPEYRLPPGSSSQPMILKLKLEPPFEEELRIFGRVGAGESRRYDFYIKGTAELVKQQYDEFLRKEDEGNFPKNERLKLIEVFLNEYQE